MRNQNETKYAMVTTYLRNYIKEHHLTAGDKLPTEMQLVEKLGTSRITIQRAIRELQQQGIVRRVQGGGTYIAGETQEAEEEKEIQFIPFVLANENDYTGALDYIQGADAYLSNHSYYLTVHSSHKNAQEECEVIKRLVEDGSKCIMIQPCSSSENFSLYFQMMQKGVEFVFVDRIPQHLVANLVVCDNVNGGYMATRHLIKCNARRIGFVSMEPVSIAYSLVQRKAGYEIALQEAGIPYDERYVQFGELGDESMRIVDRLLKLPEPPDALFCANDVTAVEVLNYLQSIHMEVPDDMILIGFDNLSIAQSAAIPISTIDQPFFKIGYEAARIARKLLSGERDYIYQEILPVELLKRASTRKIQRV